MAKDQHQVSVKLSPELRQHLKAYKSSRGQRSLKAVIVEILEKYFRSDSPTHQPAAVDSSIGRIATLEAKVTYLSEQLEAFKQAIAVNQTRESSESPTNKPAVAAVEALVAPSTKPASASHTQPQAALSIDDRDDDMYDEPDEILYSFLEP